MPLELVHRSNDADVFLTSLCRTDADTFELGARWPSGHPFFRRDPSGRHDPMTIAEIIRQSGIAVAHAGYEVEFGTQFIMADFSFTVLDPGELSVDGSADDLVVRVVTSQIVRKESALRRATLHMDLFRPGSQVFAAGDALLVCLTPALYHRMRSRHPPPEPAQGAALPPLPSPLVGRTRASDVLLRHDGGWQPGSASGSWILQVDPSHSGHFDHPLDHVPGMVQLEAFRQAALALTAKDGLADPRRFVGCTARFQRIVPLERAIRCSALTSDRTTVDVALFSGSEPEPAATGVVRLS